MRAVRRPVRRPLHRILAAVAGVLVVAGVTGCSTPDTVEVELPSQVDATLPDDTVTQVQDAVAAAMTATGATGAIVGVWAPWSGQWVAGIGTDGPDGADVDTDMVFRAADITRAMTCDALDAAVAAGDVAYDDAISDYITGMADLEDVTLAQLCDGTSGIGSYAAQLKSLWIDNPDRRWDPRELAGYGLGQARTAAPGLAWRDSDAGYLLLGLALEQATGLTASALLDEAVFTPLGLGATTLPGATPAAPSASAPVLSGFVSLPDAAGAVTCTDPRDVTTLSASIGGMDSGVVTDISDLGRYTQALATGALAPEGSDRFAEPHPVDGRPSWMTAAGGAFQAGSLIGQYGSVPGYITAAFAHPETGLTVAVVLNDSAADPVVGAYLAWEIAAIASAAPAASGQTAPAAGLPWTAQQYHDEIAASAICAAPAG